MSIGNLGGSQVTLRWVGGLVGLVGGLGLGAFLILGGQDRAARLLAFPLFLFGALSLIQAREKT
jgi:hypothetical protein